MELKKKTILIISNEPWGDIWYSKHNWAYELSKNNIVYFINPSGRWRLKDVFKNKITTTNYSKSLKILSYKNRLPFTRFKILFNLNEKIIFNSLNKYLKDNKEIIFWTFDPYRLITPNKINILFSIYFIADKYQIPREEILISNVDYIFSVSKQLTKDIKNKNVLNLSHAIAETEFITDKKVDDRFILYIGNIDYRLDYQLIEKLLQEFKDEKFLFIGKISIIKDKSFEKIFIDKRFVNIEYKEPIHFKELKNYIALAKVCLAPMKKEVHGNSINHHKLLQYLALGKPVLSAKFDDYKNNGLLIEYKNNKEAVGKLQELMKKSEDEEIINKRINFAKQYLYSSLIIKIQDFV